MSRVLRFQIRLHTGQVEQLNVEAERALIGSGAHCEIRLPVDQARVEHVLIEVGPAGIFARALSFEPPPMINNIPFTQAPLPPGSVLGVGGCQIFIELVENVQGAGGTQAQKKSSPMTVIALLIMVPVAGYMLLGPDDAPTGPPRPPREVPELWDAPITACSYGGGQALAFARERMAVADAKRERRPFHVQDGVQAVPIYETAAACFRTGGDPASGQLADDSAKFLRREMTDDFRTRRVRLEHLLNVDDDVSALKEVRVLLQFTEGRSGKYVEWLSNLDRRLKAKTGAKKS
jgi:hypothetical protein